jgi:hemolysin activation/secretion protein
MTSAVHDPKSAPASRAASTILTLLRRALGIAAGLAFSALEAQAQQALEPSAAQQQAWPPTLMASLAPSLAPSLATSLAPSLTGPVGARTHDGDVVYGNDGTLETARDHLSFNTEWVSPAASGDRVTASGLVARDSRLLNGKMGYSTLLDTAGTRGEVAVSRTHYRLIGTDPAPQDAAGTANGLLFNASNPLTQSGGKGVDVGVGAAYRDLRDDLPTAGTVNGKWTASVSANVTARADHALLGFGGQTQAGASLALGRLGFKDPAAAALDAAGANTQGNFSKLNLWLTRATALPAAFALTTSVRAQTALKDKNLDASERMSVSGAGAVGNYAPGNLGGDNAALVRMELARPFAPGGALRISTSAFADYGLASTGRSLPGVGSHDLAEVGVGLTANPAGGQLKLQLAQRVSSGDPALEPVPARTRVLLQAGWQF